MSKPETVDFAPAVLMSLPSLVPAGMMQADLALELGLTAYMQLSDTDVNEAIRQMWHIRTAILEAGEMDVVIEPIPFGGSSEQLDLLNLALYLGNLVERAAAHQDCDSVTIVARAMDRPVLQRIRPVLPEVRQLRSS
jgi:hypothetical protein